MAGEMTGKLPEDVSRAQAPVHIGVHEYCRYSCDALLIVVACSTQRCAPLQALALGYDCFALRASSRNSFVPPLSGLIYPLLCSYPTLRALTVACAAHHAMAAIDEGVVAKR